MNINKWNRVKSTEIILLITFQVVKYQKLYFEKNIKLQDLEKIVYIFKFIYIIIQSNRNVKNVYNMSYLSKQRFKKSNWLFHNKYDILK